MEKRTFDKASVVAIFLMSLVAAFLVNIRLLLTFISAKGAAETEELIQRISELIKSPFIWLDEHLLTTTATTLIFWAVIGFITSCIIFFLSDIRKEAKLAVSEGNEFIHPESFNKASYKKSIIKNLFLLFAIMTSFIVTVILTFKVFVPLSNDTLYTLLYNQDINLTGKVTNLLLSYLSILLAITLFVFIRNVYKILRLKLNT